ncbi:dynein regulatory complex protein 8-like [Oratosquilla oratoria]|uniref:dynein regulatory complex protein 8-like n=1 Tax=Oratosquilla oratoria TaxID=337810 RepID=UPI003F7696CD
MAHSLDKKLTETFTLFQDKEKNVVSVKDIPAIIRALGVVPSESEMQKVVTAMVGDESADTVHIAAFLTVAKKIVVDRRYLTSNRSEISRALAVLAKEGRTYLAEVHPQPPREYTGLFSEAKKIVFRPAGSLVRDDLVRLLVSEGEPLTLEEAEELVVSVPIKDTDFVDIEQYAAAMSPESNKYL